MDHSFLTTSVFLSFLIYYSLITYNYPSSVHFVLFTMLFSLATTLALISVVVAAPADDLLARDSSKCPTVWSSISSDLTKSFKGSDG